MNHAIIFHVNNRLWMRPLGGHKIASYLRQNGWDVEVVDFAAYWELEELKELTRKRTSSSTVFFGFSFFMDFSSSLVSGAPVAAEFIKWCKETYPGVATVFGSSHRPRARDTAIYKYIDYYVHGYGEKAILDIVASLTGNTPAGGLRLDPAYDFNVISANKSYPAFPMSSLLTLYEKRDYITQDEWLTTEFSRGCIFKCLYCNFPVLGVKGDYTRTAEDLDLQLRDTYDRFGVNKWLVADETFNDYSEKIVKYADVVKKLPFQPYFTGFIRGDLLVKRRQDWAPLLDMGLYGHFYGIESMNPETLKAIGKGMHPDKLLPGLIEAKDYFMSQTNNKYRGTIAIVGGLPHETPESLSKAYDWLATNWKGQATLVNVLDLMVNDPSEVPSQLSIDAEKWGYEFVEELDDNYNYEGIDFNVPSLVDAPNAFSDTSRRFLWKNNIWNKREAAEHIRTFMKSREFDEAGFRIGNFTLPYVSYTGNYGLDILSKHYTRVLNTGVDHFRGKVKYYAERKLRL